MTESQEEPEESLAGGEVEHREPTVATVKELYAHAFTCAKPDCPAWLYRHEEGAIAPVLNSRVSHIHARRSGGPRWDPEMSETENRSATNLLLMCIPHSYEIDDHPDRFPAEMLQEWRRAQRDEHRGLQKSWPLNDDEVQGVRRASFGGGAPEILASLARAIEKVASAAEQARRGPASAAARWIEMREAVRRSTGFIFDDEGERIFAEPPRSETKRHQDTLREALRVARDEVEAHILALKAEIAAAHATVPKAAGWLDWVMHCAEEVQAASSRWPGPGPVDDDAQLANAVNALREGLSQATAFVRGDSNAAPPAIPVPDDQDDQQPDALDAHIALLERARPFGRVTHRAYDAGLREELVVAVGEVVDLPPIWATGDIGLRASARLAAFVAGNATDAEVEALIESDAVRPPASVAVFLLFELSDVMRLRGRGEMAQRARDAILERLRGLDWMDPDVWAELQPHAREILDIWGALSTPHEVREQLAAVLRAHPDRGDEVVRACAGWQQQEQPSTGALTWRQTLRETRPWMPIEEIVAVAASTYPDVAAATDEYDDRDDDVERLLAHLLRLRG